MTALPPGGIDCDIHPAVPGLKSLLPYLADHWRDSVVQRGLQDRSIAYPANAPLTSRPDWRPESGKPGSDLDLLRRDALDAFGSSIAICNCLYGAPLLFSEDMGAGFARAINDWMAKEWLDKELRLRASIVIPTQNAELAVEEIDRVAPDRRFVQVLMPLMLDAPLGKRQSWPIYAAAEKTGCRSASMPAAPIVIRSRPWAGQLLYRGLRRPGAGTPVRSIVAGSGGRVHQVSRPDGGADRVRRVLAAGPSVAADQVLAQAAAGSAVGGSLADRDRAGSHPADRQPFDVPDDPGVVERLLEHIGSDQMLLFATDYPHWHFDGTARCLLACRPAWCGGS